MKHALFSFSKLPMLKLCPHWVGGLSSAATERGTEIHKRIQGAFQDGVTLEGMEGKALELLREIYTAYQFETFEFEKKVDTSIPHVSGYADFVFTNSSGDFAAVIELKTGWGERSHCKDSLQVKAISLGLLEQGIQSIACWLIEVDKGTSTSHGYAIEDIESMRQDVLQVVAAAIAPREYCPGAQCGYCAKAVICPEIDATIATLADISKAIEHIQSLPPAQIAERLNLHYDKAMIIEKYISAVKGRAMAIIEAGGEIEGWTIKESGGNRTWIDEIEAAWQISEAYPDVAITGILPVAKVEKALKAVAPPKAVRELLAGLTKQSVKKTLERKNKKINKEDL